MRYRVGVKVRVVDNSNMRGQIGEIKRQGYGTWWVWLDALGREVPFDETEIEPVDDEEGE